MNSQKNLQKRENLEFRINPVIYSTPGQEKSGCDVRRRGYMCTFDPRYFNDFNIEKGTVPCPYIDKASTPYTYGFHKTLLSIINFFFLPFFFLITIFISQNFQGGSMLSKTSIAIVTSLQCVIIPS